MQKNGCYFVQVRFIVVDLDVADLRLCVRKERIDFVKKQIHLCNLDLCGVVVLVKDPIQQDTLAVHLQRIKQSSTAVKVTGVCVQHLAEHYY